jgi:predicted TIM-barrel fold metal-dependent hydrolase
MIQRKRIIAFSIVAIFILISVFSIQPLFIRAANADLEPSPYAINDAHCHFVDFLQNSEGAKALLKAMDSAGVKHTVIYGLPVVKKWDSFDDDKPLYYTDNDSNTYYYSLTDVILARQILALPKEQQERLHPFICGFNPTDRNAIDHVQRMMEWYPGLWQGIGEILTRKGELTPLTYGETARANHIALDPVYDFAAKNDLPVWVHSNAGSTGIKKPIYLKEISEAVSKHPNTRFVWCHAGYSRGLDIPTLVDDVRKMLEKNKNLWVDISWVTYEQQIVEPGGTINPDWKKLITDFPGRFMIGTDKIGSFINVPEGKTTYKQEILKYVPLLKALNPEIARKVAADNLWDVLPKRVRK